MDSTKMSFLFFLSSSGSREVGGWVVVNNFRIAYIEKTHMKKYPVRKFGLYNGFKDSLAYL